MMVGEREHEQGQVEEVSSMDYKLTARKIEVANRVADILEEVKAKGNSGLTHVELNENGLIVVASGVTVYFKPECRWNDEEDLEMDGENDNT